MTTAFARTIAEDALGVNLPKGSDDQTMYDEYDELMELHGRRQEFRTPSRSIVPDED